MQTVEVKTGFGYYQDTQGHVVSKAELPEGSHRLAEGLIYIELQNRDELDAIEVYIDPAEIEKQDREKLIRDKTRELAIAELKKEGKLPPDYEDD